MKILLIHHLESCWESGYRKFGTSFDELSEKVINHLEENKYDLVLLTRFEGFNFEDCHHYTGLSNYINKVEEYGYGWCRDMFDYDASPYKYGYDYTDGGNHSEVVYLPEWLKEFCNDEIYLCGAFDGECIEDMEIALEAIGINYKRVEELIVG